MLLVQSSGGSGLKATFKVLYLKVSNNRQHVPERSITLNENSTSQKPNCALHTRRKDFERISCKPHVATHPAEELAAWGEAPVAKLVDTRFWFSEHGGMWV